MSNSDDARARNRDTVSAYDRYAPRYAEATKEISAAGRALLGRFAQALPPQASVLDIGSGPGWDADALEVLGHTVRRTDAAPAFVALQRARGKAAEVIDVVNDDIDGAYDGVLIMYVLQHVDRQLTAAVVAKLQDSLRRGGSLLRTVREGQGAVTERAQSGDYHSTLWAADEFTALLERAGLSVAWDDRVSDSEGDWLVILARRSS